MLNLREFKFPTSRPAVFLWSLLGALGLYGVLAVLKWSALTEPYYWDSMGYVTVSARKWLESSATLIPMPVGNTHPPLFFAALALAWRVFGESPLVAHLFCLI